MTEKILEVKNLTKYFGGVRALEDVTLHVEKGALVGLIGPNGSGKTTLFNLITGFYPPDKGEVYFKGRRIDGFNPNEVFKMGLVRTFQNPRLFFQMSVWENMLVIPQDQKGESIVWAPFRKAWKFEEIEMAQKAKSLLESFRLANYAINKASDLSACREDKIFPKEMLMQEMEELFYLFLGWDKDPAIRCSARRKLFCSLELQR